VNCVIRRDPGYSKVSVLEWYNQGACQSGWRCLKSPELLNWVFTVRDLVLLKKLTVSQLVKTFPSLYGTTRFITAFTPSRRLLLLRATSIKSMLPYYFLYIYFNITLSSKPWDFKLIYFPQSSPTIPYTLYNSPLSHTMQISRQKFSYWLDIEGIIYWKLYE